jgi:DNA-directed RNA polymerase subunit beta'
MGGVVGVDVTQGLPRVEELLELRTPKVFSPLSEVAGKVEIKKTAEGYKVKIKPKDQKLKEKTYLLPSTSSLKVEDGQEVEVGQPLASGSLDLREVLALRGLRSAQEYLVSEVQSIYESQGIRIHDKHFEVIVSQMSQKVKIIHPGETEFLPGELVDKVKAQEAKKKAKGKGLVFQEVILGLTRASLETDSWLSAASFQNTTAVLTQAAIEGKEDHLLGLKENVIIGRLIPVTKERARLKKMNF